MLRIIFENQNLVVGYKEAGFLSVDSRLGKSESRPVFSRILEEQLKIRLFPVHRLDFEVGGLMLLAKNTQTHKILSQSFENHEVRKTYRALSAVYDDPEKDLNKSQIWQSKLVRGKKRSFEAAHGKEAITKATALEKRCYLPSQMCLVWKLEPVTGRAHQLRYEMSKRNHPIIGDSLYGSELNFKTNAIALEAIRLELLNSDTLAKLKLESGIFEIKPELTHVH